MEYSIQELSRLSGVTTRALRWYDRIGLLKPARVAESGYRYYGAKEVDRLQEILLYKALGVELSRIRALLDDPAFDRREALERHLTALREKRRSLDRVIASVEETLRTEERNERMSDEQKFEAFRQKALEEQEAAYGAEAREAYGSAAVDAAGNALKGLSREQYEAWMALDETLRQKLEEAVEAGVSPESETGKELCALHARWLAVTVSPCDAGKHRGIAELYVLDERFTRYYDRRVSGCAAFLRDAVRCWAGR